MDFPESDQSYPTKLSAVGAIHVDFSKASIRVSFKLYGTKLSQYTVNGWTDSWLRSCWIVGLKVQGVVRGLCSPEDWWQWSATSVSALGPALF